MKRILLLLLACFPSVFMLAQVPETYWVPDNVGQFNITLFAQLSLAGDVPNSQESPVANYELGVFDQDGKCCGVAYPPTWKNVRQRWVYSLAIQGETGSTYTFKIYDHATGQELPMACSEDVDHYEFNVVEDASSPNYGDGCTYGYTYNPDTLHFMPAQMIALSVGWNWISTYIHLNEVDGIRMLEAALGDYATEIQTFGESAEYFGDGEWAGLEDYEWTNAEMVMVYVLEDCTITLAGPTVVDPSTVEIEINPGWNWIGFPVNTETDIDVALSDFEPVEGDIIATSTLESDYIGEWLDLESLAPGQGYMYYSSSEDIKTLVFSVSTRIAKLVPSKVLVP